MAEQGYEIEKAEAIRSFTSTRKLSGSFLELSKFKFYFLLQGISICLILLYQSLWLFSKPTVAYCYAYNADQLLARGEDPGTLVYHYIIDDETFRETTTRNGFPVDQHYIKIRYLPLFPSVSRPDNFESNWAGFIIAWGLFFVISTMIFFIPNETMPANSYFYFTRKKPWINMILK